MKRGPTAPHLIIRTENTTSITYLTQPCNILQHSKANKTLYLTTSATQLSHNPHTVTTPDIKTNMRHIHTSIVSRHLTTRGNNKILRTLSPHISCSEEILPSSLVTPLPNSEQINPPHSNHTYTKLMQIKSSTTIPPL